MLGTLLIYYLNNSFNTLKNDPINWKKSAVIAYAPFSI
ncbi:hypothetical protein STAWA0001_0180 [Staphylococcus warneri L37603]|nr:hypothetical protein STAWA0001_0180 [Staphylococcus warneri L37603]